MSNIVVCGIGTDVGKTVVSSILVEKFKCDYWKPVQSGELENSDTMKVKNLVSSEVNFIPEVYKFKNPLSPHLAAEMEDVKIEIKKLTLPNFERNTLIEGAGGLMVPLDYDGLLYIDLIKSWDLPVVLVSRHYLGSINHTMLSLEILEKYGIKVKALIWVGNENKGTERVILNRFEIENVHRVEETNLVNKSFVVKESTKLKFELF
jgi:dethiobiotin synthetase